MKEVHRKKKEFVENELQALLKKAIPTIKSVWYNVSENATAEYVTVEFSFGRASAFDVTANSLLAIAKDVLKRFEY